MSTPAAPGTGSAERHVHEALLAGSGAATRASAWRIAALSAIVIAALAFTGSFDRERLIDGLPALAQIASEMMPPDFARGRAWMRPLLDTLAMSIAISRLAEPKSTRDAATVMIVRNSRASRTVTNVLVDVTWCGP